MRKVRWRSLLIVCFLVYVFFLYVPVNYKSSEEGISINGDSAKTVAISDRRIQTKQNVVRANRSSGFHLNTANKFAFEMIQPNGERFWIEDVLTRKGPTLEERLKYNGNSVDPKKVILGWNTEGLSESNLGGCPDWNCQYTSDKRKVNDADAVIMMHTDHSFQRRLSSQYVIFFSQESPVNTGYDAVTNIFFNMSFGFRHDTPAASPYGYTVKLAEKSRKSTSLIDSIRVQKKSKAAAWFVSHCSTNSHREELVKEMQKTIPVDVYGACGPKRCDKGNPKCEKMLDEDYHFYVAFENSICEDYITEKVWSQGYMKDIIPITLKRSIAEPLLPPNSFIAVDDFETVEALTSHMHELMRNKTKYMEYFNWRKDYKVIFLDGLNHDILERPWGFCQICRLLWEKPKQHHVISDFSKWWYGSCENDGDLVKPILLQSRLTRKGQR